MKVLVAFGVVFLPPGPDLSILRPASLRRESWSISMSVVEQDCAFSGKAR
jgi:hypothetical protein